MTIFYNAETYFIGPRRIFGDEAWVSSEYDSYTSVWIVPNTL